MRIPLFITLLVLLAVPGPAQSPGSEDNGSVEGVVRAEGTGAPIENATVRLAGRTTQSDGAGRFAFRDVVPGQYQIYAGLAGFYTRNTSAFDMPRITVPPQGRVDGVVVELTQLSVISGRVLDSAGEPVVGASVVASRPAYDTDGRRYFTLNSQTSDFTGAVTRNDATTDDQGNYRIFHLVPGAYYVGTGYSPRLPDNPRVYFPGTFDDEAALPVLAKPGAEVLGINLRFPRAPDRPTTFTIAGRVTGGPPGVLEKPISVLYLVRRDGQAGGFGQMPNMAPDRSEGRFLIRGVLPGEYDVYPEVRDEKNRAYTGRLRLDVRRNYDDIVIAIDPGVTIRGRVVLDGSAPNGRLGESIPLILSRDRAPSVFYLTNPNTGEIATVFDRNTGEFTLRGAPPGTYDATLQIWFSESVYVADVIQNGVSVMDSGFTVGIETNPVEIVVRTSDASVEGVVQNAKQDRIAGATVVLVPPASRRQNADLYQVVTTARDGSFRLPVNAGEGRSVPPGEYKVFAWESVPTNAWHNEAFMAQYETRGIPVDVKAGDKTVLQLVAIPESDR